MKKLVIALQFWEGDRDAAMRNAVRIADNEPKFREDVIFMFVARFDCPHDIAVAKYVGQKFKTEMYTGFRRGKGWPHGCNELWCDLMQESIRRTRSGEWEGVDGILTFEADCVPVRRDWLDVLRKAWDEALAQNKMVLGHWLPEPAPLGHINGNAIFDPNIAIKLGLVGCSSETGWDFHWGPKFAPHAVKSDLIRMYYHCDGVPESWFVAPGENNGEIPAMIHGIKDGASEKYADRVLRSEKSDTFLRA